MVLGSAHNPTPTLVLRKKYLLSKAQFFQYFLFDILVRVPTGSTPDPALFQKQSCPFGQLLYFLGHLKV